MPTSAHEILNAMRGIAGLSDTLSAAANQGDALASEMATLNTYLGTLTASAARANETWVRYTQTMYDLSRSMGMSLEAASKLEYHMEKLSKTTVFSIPQIAQFYQMQATNISLATASAQEYGKVIKEVSDAFGAQGAQVMGTLNTLTEGNLQYTKLLTNQKTAMSEAALLLDMKDKVGMQGALDVAALLDRRDRGPAGNEYYLDQIRRGQKLQSVMENVQLNIGQQAGPGFQFMAGMGATVGQFGNSVSQTVGAGPTAFALMKLAQAAGGYMGLGGAGQQQPPNNSWNGNTGSYDDLTPEEMAVRREGMYDIAKMAGLAGMAAVAGSYSADRARITGSNLPIAGGLAGQVGLGLVTGGVTQAGANAVAFGAMAVAQTNLINSYNKRDAEIAKGEGDSRVKFIRGMENVQLRFKEAISVFGASVKYFQTLAATEEAKGSDVVAVGAQLAKALPNQQAVLSEARSAFNASVERFAAYMRTKGEDYTPEEARQKYAQSAEGQAMMTNIQQLTKSIADMAYKVIPLVSSFTQLQTQVKNFGYNIAIISQQSSTIAIPAAAKLAAQSLKQLDEAVISTAQYFTQIYSDPKNMQGIQHAATKLKELGDAVEITTKNMIQYIDAMRELPVYLQRLNLIANTRVELATTLGAPKEEIAKAEQDQGVMKILTARQFFRQTEPSLAYAAGTDARANAIGNLISSTAKNMPPAKTQEEIDAMAESAAIAARANVMAGPMPTTPLTITDNSKKREAVEKEIKAAETRKKENEALSKETGFKVVNWLTLGSLGRVKARAARGYDETIKQGKAKLKGLGDEVVQVGDSLTQQAQAEKAAKDAYQKVLDEEKASLPLYEESKGLISEMGDHLKNSNVGLKKNLETQTEQAKHLKLSAEGKVAVYGYRGITSVAEQYEMGLEARKRYTEIVPVSGYEQYKVRGEEVQWLTQKKNEMGDWIKENVSTGVWAEGSKALIDASRDYYQVATALAQAQMDIWGGFTGKLEAELDKFINGPADVINWQPRAADVAGMDIPAQAKPFMQVGYYGNAITEPMFRNENTVNAFAKGDLPIGSYKPTGFGGMSYLDKPDTALIPTGLKALSGRFNEQGVEAEAAREAAGQGRESEKELSNAFATALKAFSKDGVLRVRVEPSNVPRTSGLSNPPGYTTPF